ncbi:MFS transporter [Lacibacterium aquatile]|uniref:MFS transporter n=1 Tax=Lacibacterium aquatile TaxID=1168082 RepID=A0ABW5DPI3_9PROT
MENNNRIAVWRLVGAQAVSMTASNIVTVSVALASLTISTDPSLATLPFALQMLATMLATVPASMAMQRYGRTPIFVLGAIIGVIGALLATWALWKANFALFCVAGFCMGGANAVALYYRFAAAEAADEAYRPRAIALVMGGGVISALFGAEVAKFGRDLLAPAFFVGTYIIIAAMQVLNAIAISRIRLPRPPVAKFGAGRPMAEIARTPGFTVALLSGVICYSIMVLLMTATPLAMASCGLAFEDSAFVIQWHALAMYAPSFVTGRLIQRFGAQNILASGILLMAGAITAALSGESVGHFWVSLVALGLGWNFLFVGGTALLTVCYRPEERAKVQAVNDLSIFTVTAIASFAAGYLQSHIGWQAVNLSVLPLLGCLALVLVLRWQSLVKARA